MSPAGARVSRPTKPDWESKTKRNLSNGERETTQGNRQGMEDSDTAAVMMMPTTIPIPLLALPPSLSSHADPLSSVAYGPLLRTFLDDCLSTAVGAERALARLGGEDAMVLERLARYSLEWEERTQTGCLMIQALTLVRYWTIRAQQSIAPADETRVIQWCQLVGVCVAHISS